MKKNSGLQDRDAGIPTSFRNAVSALKGRKPAELIVPDTNSPILLPVSAQIVAAEAEERVREQAERMKNLHVGDEVSGGDIFFGIWTPTDRGGNSLEVAFNLFAQPQDISANRFSNLEAQVESLSNGFNHRAKGKTSDEALYDALRSGSYKGQYFIPTKDILRMLYMSRHTGKLDGTFSDKTISAWYWSCTAPENEPVCVWFRQFRHGEWSWHHKDTALPMSTRLVRAELRP